jgi:hypothetical protein
LESNLSTSFVINVFSCLYASHEFCQEAIWMTSSSPAVACLDYPPHKGVGEVAVRARRSSKSFWLGMVLQVTYQEFDSHIKYQTFFFFVGVTVPMRLVYQRLWDIRQQGCWRVGINARVDKTTVRSESHCALRLRYVDLLLVWKSPLKCAVVSLYSVVKQRWKCDTGKVCNCLTQFLLTVVLSSEERVL